MHCAAEQTEQTFFLQEVCEECLNVIANLDLEAQLIPLDIGQLAQDCDPDGRRKWIYIGQTALSSVFPSPRQEKHKKSFILSWDQKTTQRRESLTKKPLSLVSAAIACQRLDCGLRM